MSLMGLNRFVKKHGTIVFSILAVLMVGGVVFSGLGGNLMNRGGGSAPAAQTAPTEQVVAKVGDLNVTRAMLDNVVQRQIQQQAMFGGPAQQPKPDELDLYRIHFGIEAFKQQQAMIAAAKAAGVSITDADVAQEREKLWQQQRSQFAQSLSLPADATDGQIDNALSQQGVGRNVASIKAGIPDYAISAQLAQEGLQKAMRGKVQVNPDLVKRSYDDIQVRHILIKSGQGGLPDDQAKSKAQKLLDIILKDPSKMPQLAKENSDDPGSKKDGGFYAWKSANTYVTPFAEAALQAGVGKVYPEPVKTQFGYHIIKLEGDRPGKDLPKDFEQKKQSYIDQYQDKIVQAKVQEAIQAQQDAIKVDLNSPALRAAQLQLDTMQLQDKKLIDAKLTAALVELDKVAKADDVAGAVPMQKAKLLERLGRDKDAIAAYQDALKFRNTPEMRLALSHLYLKQKDTANAKAQLGEADKLFMDPMQEMELSQLLKQVGDNAGAKRASDKAIEMFKRQQEAQKAEAPPMVLPPAAKGAPTTKGAVPPAASSAPVAAPVAAPAASTAAASPATAPATAPAAAPSAAAPAAAPASPAAGG